MRPQDIVVLLKIISYKDKKWLNKELATDLYISTAEVSNSLKRSTVTGLVDNEKKKVRIQALQDFIIYGLPYVFPQLPGGIARGLPTAHSHPFMKHQIISEELYVWPDAESDLRGFSIEPLYPGAVKAAKKDHRLYLMLAMVDVLRLGKAREKKIAITELEKLFRES